MNNLDLINKRTFKRAQKNHIFMKWAFGGEKSISKSLKYWIDNHSDLYTPIPNESLKLVFTKIYTIYKKITCPEFPDNSKLKAMESKFKNKHFRKWAFGRIRSIVLGADYWNKNHGHLYKTKNSYISNEDVKIIYMLYEKYR